MADINHKKELFIKYNYFIILLKNSLQKYIKANKLIHQKINIKDILFI